MTPEDLFGANASEIDKIAAVLDAFPGHRDGVMVPIPVKSRRPWAEALYKRGLRLHVELMEEFPIPGDHPEAGPLNPRKWRGREEYEKYAATRPSKEQSEQQLKNLLSVVDPQMLQRIESMSDAEKREQLARQAPHMGDLLAQINEVRGLLEEQQRSKE